MVHFHYGTIHYVIHFPLSTPCVIPSHVKPAFAHMICFSPCEKQPLWQKLLLLFNHSVVSNALWPHGLQHARLPCPSPTPRVCSNSCPLSQWSHPTILSSVFLSSCLQSFPPSGSFPMSRLFAWGGQSTGTTPSASVLPMNIQGWFPIGWTGLISLQARGLSRVFSSTSEKSGLLLLCNVVSCRIPLWTLHHT